MGNRETIWASRNGWQACGKDDGDDMLALCSDMIGAIFRKPTRQDFLLLSLPPSIQADAQLQQAQAKDHCRGSRHDDSAMQKQRI